MNENKTNFFCIPALSFVPAKYNELVKNSAGKIFGAIFLLFILLGVITGIKVTSAVNEAAEEISANCPDFKLSNGEFSISKSYSFNEEGYYFVIDDSLTGIDESYIKELVIENFGSQIMVVGRDSLGIYNNGQVQAIKYKDLGNLTFSKETLINELIPTVKPLLFALMVVIYMFAVGFYYLAALIMSLFTKLICYIMKKDIDSKSRFRMTVLTKLPVYLITFVVELVSPLSINLFVAIILVIIYTAVVVKCFNTDDTNNYTSIEDTYSNY